MKADGDASVPPTAYKAAQLRYRRQPLNLNRSDDFTELLDFSNPSLHPNLICPYDPEKERFYRGPLFTISSVPGFLYAPQAISKSLQMDLAHQSLSEYCEPPHATNMDATMLPPNNNGNTPLSDLSLWTQWKQENNFQKNTERKTSENSKGAVNIGRKRRRCLENLSWATMGYQYDWNARSYTEDAKSPVSPLLACLSKVFAEISLPDNKPFTPSACIIKIYTDKTIMGGHQDDLEFAMDKPVVSISMGLPAIFLLGGGPTKEDGPVLPILIRPGDVMLLGGSCRLYHHGLARVIPAQVSTPAPYPPLYTICNQHALTASHLCTHAEEIAHHDTKSLKLGNVHLSHEDLASLDAYLSQHRININVRQVLPDGVETIPVKNTDG
jgi:DNA alkylation damage repair protein AlkB